MKTAPDLSSEDFIRKRDELIGPLDGLNIRDCLAVMGNVVTLLLETLPPGDRLEALNEWRDHLTRVIERRIGVQ